jgi:putative membrane protein
MILLILSPTLIRSKKTYIYNHLLTPKIPWREDTCMLQNRQKTVLDAQKSVEQTASVMEHLFRAPKPVILIGPILLISLLFGILIGLDINDPYHTFIVNGIMILAVPTYLSAIISVPLAESLGGKLYLRRSMLMSFLSLLIVAGILVLFSAINLFVETGVETIEILIFGYSATIWLRHLSLLSTSQSSHAHSLPASLSQPIIGFMMLIIFMPPFGLKEIFLAVIFLIIFLFSVYILTQVATLPMKKAFGVDGLAMVRYSLDHITEGGYKGAFEVEEFFKSFSQKMDVHVGLVAFKRGDQIKSMMIVPSVHPGPFGLLGGSDLPKKLTDSLKDRSKKVMVPHGSATHDLNLASSEDKNKIAEMVRGTLSKIEYSNQASKFIRLSNHMDVCAQQLGNGILLIHTSSPDPTDDVEYSIGSAVREKATSATKRDILFIDAHNCAEKGSGCVYFGSKKAYELLDLTEKAAMKAQENPTEGLSVGYAQKTGYETERGIGKSGIQVLVVKTNGQKAAYILFDGNNLVMGLREEIMNAVSELVDDAEVLTTDNHAVNATIGGYNPVGLRMDRKVLVRDVKILVKKALDDLEEVEVGMVTGLAKNISVFGHENVARLSSMVNSTIAVLKITTFISLLFAVVASAMVLLLV